MRSGVMLLMVGHPRHDGGAQLQRKGNAVGRHEADGHIGSKQKQGQQQDAGP
jgi:hypothetical protein